MCIVDSGKVTFLDGKRFISTTSYEACYDDELSFDAGAIVRLIRENENGWWFVHYNGREGFVPGTLFKTFDKRQASVYVERVIIIIIIIINNYYYNCYRLN